MYPRDVSWDSLRFGVEIEFVEADPAAVSLLPGWTMDTDERQRVLSGADSGGELKPGKLTWTERDQIAHMFEALVRVGGAVNWSCGLHVHVGLDPWGAGILEPLIEAALDTHDALHALFQTAPHRDVFAPPLTAAQRDAWREGPCEAALRHHGNPLSARCGVNVAAWYDFGTVEFRYPNATLVPEEVCRTVELCLRWVAAVGRGESLPTDAHDLVRSLGAPASGYPPPHAEPLWHRHESLLTEVLRPVLQPLIASKVPDAQILFVRPTTEGCFMAKTDRSGQGNHRFFFQPHTLGFTLTSFEEAD